MQNIKMTWYDTPEEVHRAMWTPVALEEGVPYEELRDSTSGGMDADGSVIEITFEQEMETIRQMGVWGFADTLDRHIHAWADPASPRETVIHMLAHEIAHLTGTPHEDDVQEELRAEAFGVIAAQAFSLLPAQQAYSSSVDRAWARFCGAFGDGPDDPYPGMIAAFETHYGQSFRDKEWRTEAACWAAAWHRATEQAKKINDRSERD